MGITLAHELGHFLGLMHVFSDDKKYPCKDADYCTDTEGYNREEYEKELDYIRYNEPDNFNFNYLVNRTNCNNLSFVSHNIMDYDVSYSDMITSQQALRVRHVLLHSPFIPGPKVEDTSSRASTIKEKIDLPLSVIN